MAKKTTKENAPRDGALAPRTLPRGESLEARQLRFQKIFGLLKKEYPNAKCALEFANAYELVAATILSAQCTDKRVNIVMPDFRKAFPNPKSLANADLADIEDVIKTTGFYHQKAKSLKSMAGDIVEKFGGKVPETMEELTTLRGVGRKTANVVLGDAFGKAEGIAVDTHVTRLSGRLGLTKEMEPTKIERDLMLLAKPSQWTLTAHVLILHGRSICIARKPKCSQCVIAEFCPSAGMEGSI
ncbi:MAG TPA: endonuclease III [Candidatus Kapabacteria bacterium]|jgi:endonuclease-3|nr:endonuclease III [Candidatus Kapabacteria bacterium]